MCHDWALEHRALCAVEVCVMPCKWERRVCTCLVCAVCVWSAAPAGHTGAEGYQRYYLPEKNRGAVATPNLRSPRREPAPCLQCVTISPRSRQGIPLSGKRSCTLLHQYISLRATSRCGLKPSWRGVVLPESVPESPLESQWYSVRDSCLPAQPHCQIARPGSRTRPQC